MNIFILDHDPKKSIEYHCDKHVVKMPIEYIQILSSVHHVIDGEHSSVKDKIYKLTHKNHPCCVWARESVENYYFLLEYAMLICDEYTERYGKIHKSSLKLEFLLNPPKGLKSKGLTKPVKCMPDEYKIGDVVESYREFYRKDKKSFAKYKNKSYIYPEWLI